MPRKCSCGTYAVFNIPNETTGICCSKCKTSDMINVSDKKCCCGKIPKFNMPEESKGVCCKDCKTDDMINVKSKRCPCGKQPVFNVSKETKGICCSRCKTDEMITVVHNRCLCGSLSPIFNVSGETIGVCCRICKTDDMIDVVHRRCSCGSRAYFNIPIQSIATCCSKCKTDGMINVVAKICPGYGSVCPVRTYISNGHKYCMSCDPNDARRKLYKRYEEEFFEYMKDKIDVHQREFRVTFDQNETSKKYARLDGIVFGDDIIVCLEVDENGHQEYECDEHRMHLVTAELLQKYPKHIVSWVRVNPTIDAKSQWIKTSKKIREKRFEDVVMTVKDILENRDTRVVYIGFD